MTEDKTTPSETLFLHTISMFQVAAMQHLGKLMDPLSGKVQRDLDQAKISIDILDVLSEKTKGNLTKAEDEFLSKVLFELHMNYVHELKASNETAEGKERVEGGEGQERVEEEAGEERVEEGAGEESVEGGAEEEEGAKAAHPAGEDKGEPEPPGGGKTGGQKAKTVKKRK